MMKGMTGQDLARLYDKDLFVWACRNAQLLREGRFAEVDIENVAEEIESVPGPGLKQPETVADRTEASQVVQ